MNDDHAPDLWLLAGDYLDGELDADERARAEADPAVMAVVAELRGLGDDLRSTPEPSSARREAAIAAALATFDELHTDPAVRPIAGRVRSGDRARSATRWLAAVAAAVVIVGGLGFVASQNGGGDDDDAAGGAELDAQADSASISTSATRAVPEQAQVESAFDDADTASASDMASVAADAAPSAATGAPADVLASEEAPGAGAPATTVAASAIYLFDPTQPIADPDQLAQAADQLLDKAEADELVNTPETSCGTDADQPLTVLSEGLYRTADAVERRIFVAVDEAGRRAVAVDPENCNTIAEAPLP